MREIFWRVFIKTRNKRKAKSIGDNIISTLGNCKDVSLEVYWKDKSMYCLEFKDIILGENPCKLMLLVMSKIRIFSNTWILEIPDNIEDVDFEFSGISSENIKIVSVPWVSFSLESK